MHRNVTDFCILTIYPVTLLNLLINSNKIVVESLGFYICKIMLSAYRHNFTSFCIPMPFIYFLARTLSTMLNNSDGNGHSFLVPNVRGKSFKLSLWSITLDLGLLGGL